MVEAIQHPTLRAAEAKLSLATEHLQAFKSEVSRVEKSGPYRIAVEFDTKSEWWVATAQVSKEPGPNIGALAGAVAYQCLSALNILVWELAARKTGSRKVHRKGIKEHIQIPVRLKPADFESTNMIAKRRVSIPAIAALRALQPYSGVHGPSGPQEHPFPSSKKLRTPTSIE